MSSGIRGPATHFDANLLSTRPLLEMNFRLHPTRYVCPSCRRFHLRPDLEPEPRCPHCLEDLDPDADEVTAE